jgi:murein DD-endopeptidase MepM/ murein hydrolase activator NlpD
MAWRALMALTVMAMTVTFSQTFAATRLEGRLIQGGLVSGTTMPGSTVTLNGRVVRVARDGRFLFGFNRDATAAALAITTPDGRVDRRQLTVEVRRYDIQRIDGLRPKMVSPPLEILARIRREGAQIKAARMHDTLEAYFKTGFQWPALGRISGIYGSQRVLNGKPSRPHYGIDVAAPIGTPVTAPADGVVRLAERDLFYSGGTIILDHGHGLSSTFLHMARVEVQPGDQLRQGDRLGTIGATGRATSPHLDWRVNWFDQRLDAGLPVPRMP